MTFAASQQGSGNGNERTESIASHQLLGQAFITKSKHAYSPWNIRNILSYSRKAVVRSETNRQFQTSGMT